MASEQLPSDGYSKTLAQLLGHPGGVDKSSTIELKDFYGNNETWVVRTLRVDGADTVFLQRINSDGGARWVLPPQVTDAIARQRDAATTVNRRRGARAAAATRKAARK